MKLSFKEYKIISDAVLEAQAEEGISENLLSAIIAKLGPKAKLQDVEAAAAKVKAKLSPTERKELEKEVDDLEKKIGKEKKTGDDVKSSIAATKASKDFHARRAEAAKAAAARQPQGTRATVGGPGAAAAKARLDATATKDMTAAQARAVERGWMGEEEKLEEGMGEFTVTYMPKTGGGRRKAVLRGRDARSVRQKFGDMYFGSKLISIEPSRANSTKKVQDSSDDESDD